MTVAAVAAVCAACAGPQVAVNPRADFGRVRRVAVVTFSGPSGDLAADLLTQSLVSRGADVIERSQLSAVLREQNMATSGVLDPRTVKKLGKILGVDALFVGTVSQSRQAQSYVVTSGRRNRNSTVTPVNGNVVVSEGPVLGVPGSQVVSTEAGASVIARMVDVTTGSILWSASMNNQGFDVQSAMQDITDSFAQSLVPVWPSLIAPKK